MIVMHHDGSLVYGRSLALVTDAGCLRYKSSGLKDAGVEP